MEWHFGAVILNRLETNFLALSYFLLAGERVGRLNL